jgi:hypothetical protein
MAYRTTRRGMGQGMPSYGGNIFLPSGGVIGPNPVTRIGVPPAPSSEFPSDEEVNQLLAAQLEAQKAANAGYVQSGVFDQLSSGLVDTGSAIGTAASSVMDWLKWGLIIGAGVFAIVAIGGGSPRRYGR